MKSKNHKIFSKHSQQYNKKTLLRGQFKNPYQQIDTKIINVNVNRIKNRGSNLTLGLNSSLAKKKWKIDLTMINLHEVDDI